MYPVDLLKVLLDYCMSWISSDCFPDPPASHQPFARGNLFWSYECFHDNNEN